MFKQTGRRLAAWRAAVRFDLHTLAVLAGVPKELLSDVESGERFPGFDLLRALGRNTTINKHWLLEGHKDQEAGASRLAVMTDSPDLQFPLSNIGWQWLPLQVRLAVATGNLGVAEFCRSYGISRPRLESALRTGQATPDLLWQVADSAEVTLEWLITGRGYFCANYHRELRDIARQIHRLQIEER